MSNVYDSFCAEQADGRAYCPTLGRCYDPLTEDCRTPGYVEPDGLPPCARTAQSKCDFAFSGAAADACSEGAVQAQRAPSLTTKTDVRSMLLFPNAFSQGMALALDLCTSSGD